VDPRCAFPGCGALIPAADRDARRCGWCAAVAYCADACRDAHWGAHKAACVVAAKARLRAGEGELRHVESLVKGEMDAARAAHGAEHFETLAGFWRTLGNDDPCTLAAVGKPGSATKGPWQVRQGGGAASRGAGGQAARPGQRPPEYFGQCL